MFTLWRGSLYRDLFVCNTNLYSVRVVIVYESKKEQCQQGSSWRILPRLQGNALLSGQFKLIHSADPQSCSQTCGPSVHPSVRPSVPTFQNIAKQNKYQAKTMFATGETVGLAEWFFYILSLTSSYYRRN